MQERIIEIRHAMVEKRPVPKPSAAYVQRSIAAGTLTLEQLSKRSGVPLADLQAAQLRGRAERLGAQIRLDQFENKGGQTAIEAHLDGIGMSPAPWEK